jgi:conjugal transfer pilus assembly protein TraL
MREIPNYLDDSQQILLWELDEFILLGLAFAIGIITNYLGILVLLGLMGIKFYRKIKDRQANGFLLHAMYWYIGTGSSETTPTSRPLSFIRRFF